MAICIFVGANLPQLSALQEKKVQWVGYDQRWQKPSLARFMEYSFTTLKGYSLYVRIAGKVNKVFLNEIKNERNAFGHIANI
jgi:hypothetical protein